MTEEEMHRKLRDDLETAQWKISHHLDEVYGSFKQAPDDHPLLEATDAIGSAADYFACLLPNDDDEEEDAA